MRYRLQKLIADSGAAIVYDAHDTQLDRPVVIKMLAPLVATHTETRNRFIREARSIAAVNHPHLVTIYDVVLTQNGAFIVMERLEGRTLDRLIPKRGFALLIGLNLAIQIADALAGIHAIGLVHRDLKPSNIVVTRDGLVKVIDFGTAKSTARRARRAAHRLTSKGVALGTPGYMSPEQVRGGTVDCRSDIFSFGILLCELLTGIRPFDGPSPAEIAAATLRDDPMSISKRLPNAALQIVARCLEKSPRSRYQTIRRVVDDLKALRAACQKAQRR